jgi:hypothetical protein
MDRGLKACAGWVIRGWPRAILVYLQFNLILCKCSINYLINIEIIFLLEG